MKHTLSFALAISLLAPACRDSDDRYGLALTTLPPVAAAGAVVFVETASARAVAVNVSGDEPSVRVVPVGAEPTAVVARNASPEALVLSRGRRGARGVAPEPGSLTALPLTGTTPARTYPVGSPFNAVAQTPDGRFAITYFRPMSDAGRLLFNPNEVALVDLTQPPSSTNPTQRTVRSFGGVPNDVVFSPPMEVNGEARTLAVVLSDAYLTLMDLGHPERVEITVRLTLPEDPRAIRPTQVLFDTEGATLYVRAAASDDVYVLRLEATTPSSADGNDFRPAINQLAAGRRPADMALVGDVTNRRLLVVSPGSSDARLIDARANTVIPIPLDAPATNILLYERGGPGGPREALLYSTSGATTAVSFMALEGIETRRGQNVETVQLQRQVTAALPLADRGVVVLGHPSSAQGRLSLLDLERRTAAPILSEVALEGARFDDDREALWVAPRSSDRVGYIDLRSFRPGELLLDGPVTDVLPVTDATGRRRVVAIHPADGGWLTVLDGAAPSREGARSIEGFLLTDVLGTVE